MRAYIQRLGRNKWRIKYDEPRGPDGQRQQRSVTVHGPEREAEAKRREILSTIDHGAYVPPTKETIGGFLDRWFATYAATRTSPRTQADYRSIINRYLAPAFGGLRLVDLRPHHVQELHATLLGRGLSARTVLHTHRVLSEALSHAVKWGVLVRNVCQAVDPPKAEAHEMQVLGWDGVHRFLDAAEASPYRDAYSVDFATGMRRSELLGLRWPQVDLEGRSLSVVAGLHRIKDRGLVLLPVKTNKSRRRIDLDTETVGLLRGLRVRQLEQRLAAGPAWGETGHVFTTADGGPVDPARLSRDFATVARRAELTGFRLHDVRHTHVALLIEAGVHVKVISERLGHAGAQVTLDIYGHLLPGLQAEAADLFGRNLRSRRQVEGS